MKSICEMKNEAMTLVAKLLPVMNEEEVGLIGFALKRTAERLEKEGRIEFCEVKE